MHRSCPSPEHKTGVLHTALHGSGDGSNLLVVRAGDGGSDEWHGRDSLLSHRLGEDVPHLFLRRVRPVDRARRAARGDGELLVATTKARDDGRGGEEPGDLGEGLLMPTANCARQLRARASTGPPLWYTHRVVTGRVRNLKKLRPLKLTCACTKSRTSTNEASEASRIKPQSFSWLLMKQRPSPCMQMQCGESRGSASSPWAIAAATWSQYSGDAMPMKSEGLSTSIALITTSWTPSLRNSSA